jgi:AraC family transcriptional regulator
MLHLSWQFLSECPQAFNSARQLLYRFEGGKFLAKIAVESETNAARAAVRGERHVPVRRILARGTGWSVFDVVCTFGPEDRAFEEQHGDACIAIVTTGTFQYRSSAGRELMTPGSLLLGNAGQYFECGHEHGAGDRCIAFQYAPEYFEELAADSRVRRLVSGGTRTTGGARSYFRKLRLPPLREFSGLVARAWAGLMESSNVLGPGNQTARTEDTQRGGRDSLRVAANSKIGAAPWEEIGVELAARALRLANDEPRDSPGASPAAEARVTRIVRTIEANPDEGHDLGALAREARLSRYHFLRVFQQLTGLTPHQYIVRGRLRRAASRLMLEPGRVADIALDCGFGDISNFNHAFRAEFGVSPRTCRGNRASLGD